MVDESDFIVGSWHFEGGLPGTDNDPDNPLSRAARSPLIDGKPQQNLSLCFYSDFIVNGTEEKPHLKWFGVFVLTHEGRLIFFPGFNFNAAGVKVARERSPQKCYDIRFDHITLEANRRHCHYTSPGSNNHVNLGLTTDLGDNRFSWFGLSIADSNVLKEVREETIFFNDKVPHSDSKRRNDTFIASLKGVDSHILSLHPDAKQRFNTGFLHFGLIVGSSGFMNYLGPNFSIPFVSPFVIEKLPDPLTNIPQRLHRISMGSMLDIEIVTLWLPGSLTGLVTFSGST